MSTEPNSEGSIAERVKEALRTGGFLLYSQVILPLADPERWRPLREILIRFREEEEKMLPPGTFFPVLEENGLLPDLDRWVVSTLVKRSRAALAEKPNLPLPRNSINLAPDTLRDAKFAAYVLKGVGDAKLPDGTISFELPWDLAMDHADLLEALMAELKPAGCRFSIAGFDGSEPSFDAVNILCPHYLKFTYGFVQRVGRTLAESEQAEAVNARCHEMGIRTIAEHVESKEMMEHLQVIGVDYAQGMAISPPKAL